MRQVLQSLHGHNFNIQAYDTVLFIFSVYNIKMHVVYIQKIVKESDHLFDTYSYCICQN
jgi:hypothetical protein